MTAIPRTLTAIKRAVTVGTRIEVLDHWQDRKAEREGRQRTPLTGTIRTVTKAQGNAYVATQPGSDGGFWAYWPKASEVTVHEDGSWTQDFGDDTATFRIAPEESIR